MRPLTPSRLMRPAPLMLLAPRAQLALLMQLALLVLAPAVLGETGPLVPGAGAELAAELGGRPLLRSSTDALYQEGPGGIEPQRGLFVYFRPGEQPLRPVVEHTRSAGRGEAVSGRVSAERPLAALEVSVLSPGQAGRSVASARGFRLDGDSSPGPRRGGQWAFLVGLPSTLAAGTYTLRICGTAREGLFLYLAPITVAHREFRTETIAFDASLSSLLTAADPRRDREAIELQEILRSFHPAAVFHAGRLELPVDGERRTSRYADRRLYRFVDGGSSRSLHNGLDLASPEGSPVRASGAGRVVLARNRLMSGNSVILEHLPGVYTLYYHLRDIDVQEGDLVAQGARIGSVGQTGLATGPHLHWELRVSGVAVDPEVFLERALIDNFLDSGTLIDSRS